MLRGIIIGLFWGGCLGFLLASVVSLVMPLPANIESQTTAVTVETPNVDVGEGLGETSTTDAPVQASAEAQSPAASEGTDMAPLADQNSAPKPEPTEVANVAPVPEPTSTSDIRVQTETPVAQVPSAINIENPETEQELSITTEPRQPAAPVTIDTSAFGAPEVSDSPSLPSTISQGTDLTAAPAQTVTDTEDSAPSVDATTARPVAQDMATVTEDAPAESSSPLAPQSVEDSPAQVSEDLTQPDPQPVEVDTEIAALPDPAPSLLKPAGDIESAFPQRTSTRLPTVSGDAAEETVVEETVSEEGVTNTTPLWVNSTPFDNPNNLPIFSVVLLDDPDTEVDLEALRDFPVGLSIAIDATLPDAAGRMTLFRSLGLEVLATVDLPAGAQVSDIEINLDAQLGAVNQAVAVLEGFNGGLQENREVSEQTIAFAQSTGYGLLFQQKGLNTAQKLAVREGVPAASIFRDFDGKGQTSVVMRRFLDQAAFKARQENGVVMLGRLQPETISALASWALQDRAGTVALAPVSALLKAQEVGVSE